MIKRFSLIIACLFVSVSNAFACSVITENRSGEFDFSTIKPRVYDRTWSPLSENALEGLEDGQPRLDSITQSSFVYLANAKLIDTEIRFERYLKHPLQFLRFDVEDTLKGQPRKTVWFTEDGSSVGTILSKPYIINGEPYGEGFSDFHQGIIDSQKTFAFWDTQILMKPAHVEPQVQTSCGPAFLPQALNSAMYIVYINYLEEVFYIPVNGPSDPIVLSVKNALEKKKYVKIRLSAENYFRHMKFSVPIKLTCSEEFITLNSEKKYFWDPFTDYPLERYNGQQIGEDVKKLPGASIEMTGPVFDRRETDGSKLEINAERLNSDWPAIISYYRDKDSGMMTCQGDEQFLVFGYEKMFVSSDYRQSFVAGKYLSHYRFAKIIDGDVLTASIHSNIALTGPERIPLGTVLSWIKQGNPEPLNFDLP